MPLPRPLPFHAGEWIQVGTAVHLGLLTLLHLLQGGDSAVATPTGTLVLGRGGFALVLATLALALALASTAVGAVQAIRPGRTRSAAVALLGGASAAAVLSAIVPTEGQVPPVLPVTGWGWTHLAAAGCSTLLALSGAAAFTRAAAGDDRWTSSRPALRVLVGLLAGAVVAAALAWPLQLVGLAQRIVLGLLSAWLLLVGHRVRTIRRGPVSGPRILARIE